MLKVEATTADKAIAVSAGAAANGTVEVSTPKADAKERVQVTLAPQSGYRPKSGTVRAIITVTENGQTRETSVACTRGQDGSYSFEVPEGTPGTASIRVTASFEMGSDAPGTKAISAGVAVGVSVVRHANSAVVRSGEIRAQQGVTVSAESGDESERVSAVNEAKAGYSAGNIGVGGAVAVSVNTVKTSALIHEGTTLAIGGELNVEAESFAHFGTKADASGNLRAGNTGVGAGIAVGVSGADTNAGIADGTTLKSAADSAAKTIDLDGLRVIAQQDVTDAVLAKAGSAGGYSITPVVALDVAGSGANAYLGRTRGATIDMARQDQELHTVVVFAKNMAAHDAAANASAAGSKVAAGGAFAISVINDGARAHMLADAKANGVYVGAQAGSTLKLVATASAAGGGSGSTGANGKGSADNQTDKLIGGAGKLAGSAGSRSISQKQTGSQAIGRQPAQTSEGSVAGAAGFALNIMRSTSEVFLGGGARITAVASENCGEIESGNEYENDMNGAVRVVARNRTEAAVKANASTSKAATGIGAAVAINIVNIENTATVGKAAIQAETLDVRALMIDMTDGDENEESKKDATAFEERLKAVLEGLISDLLKELGLDKYLDSKALASSFAEKMAGVANTFMSELLKGTGLEQLLKIADLEAQFSENITAASAALEQLPDAIIGGLDKMLTDAFGSAFDLESWKSELSANLKKNFSAGEIAKLLLPVAKDSLLDTMLSYIECGLSGKQFDKTMLQTRLKASLSKQLAAAKAKLHSALLETVDEHLPGSVTARSRAEFERTLSVYMDAEVERYAANLVAPLTKNMVDLDQMINFVSNDMAGTFRTNFTNAVRESGLALTSAAVDTLTAWLDVQLEPEELGDKHVIRTESVAGAGSSKIGVAGTVAIAVINGKTAATIVELTEAEKTNYPLEIAGATRVDAQNNQRVKTTASSSLAPDGSADANKPGGAADTQDAGNGGSSNVIDTDRAEISVDQGGEAAVNGSDVTLTAKEGYKLPATVSYEYTDSDGKTKTGTFTVGADGRFTIAPPADMAADGKLTVRVAFAENLHEIVTRATGASENPVTVSAYKAKMNDLVKVNVKNLTGKKLTKLTYTYSVDGRTYEKEIVVVDSSSAAEKVFCFYMPDAQIVTVHATFADDPTNTAAQPVQNGRGKSVGVGAAFAFTYGDTTTEAGIASNRTLETGTLEIRADADRKVETGSVSGTDPLESGNPQGEAAAKNKDVALDASVAVNALTGSVRTFAGNGTNITAAGGNSVAVDPDDEDSARVNLLMIARETGEALANASGFAMGNSTAVGAAVALNVISTDILTAFEGSAKVSGEAKLGAYSYSADVSNAIATAIGSDMQRYLDRFGKAQEDAEKIANGEGIPPKTEHNKSNETADRLNGQVSGQGSGEEARNDLPLSSNVLRSQDAQTPGTNAAGGATNTGASQASGAAGKNLTGGDYPSQGSKLQVAAAVGLTVSNHKARTLVSGLLSADGGAQATAVNEGNFRTLGTGASISLANKANSIAAGVAVSVNNNEAIVEINGGSVESNGDVELSATLTQNMNGDFRGQLAAQALAGAVSGSGSSASVGGAIAVLASNAKTKVIIADGTGTDNRATITGENVVISTSDKTKLAARAGGVSVSKGSSVGVGASAAIIYANNQVESRIGDWAKIQARSLLIRAEKLGVTREDYQNAFGIDKILSDSSKLDEGERSDANTGIIDVKKGADGKSYTVSIKVKSSDLLAAVDLLNFLSATNYYAEAIAGSIMSRSTQSSNASVAGSLALVYFNNRIEALVGRNVEIDVDGDATIEAKDEANARIIAGALSAAPSKAGVGLTFGYLQNEDRVRASVGENSEIRAAGRYAQKASTNVDAQLFTVAASLNSSAQGAATVGGALNVIATKNTTESSVADGAKLTAGKGLDVLSETEMALLLISVSTAIAAGGTVAAGGTFDVIVNETETAAKIGKGATLLAEQGDISVRANERARLASLIASASAANGANTVAGALSVLVTLAKTVAAIGEGSRVEAKNGGISVLANSEAWGLNGALAASGSNGANAIGATVNVNVFDCEVKVRIGGEGQNQTVQLISKQDILAQACAKDVTIVVAVAAGVSSSNGAFSGTIPVVSSKSRIENTIGGNTKMKAAGNIAAAAHYDSKLYVAAGGLSVSASGTAAGLAASTVIYLNFVQAVIGKGAELIATAATANETELASRRKFKGVYVGATARETVVMATLGVSGGAQNAAQGVVNTMVTDNTVAARANGATLIAGFAAAGETAESGEGDVTIEADDDTAIYNCAGSLAVGGSNGAGATIVALVFDKDVTAEATDADVRASRDVKVAAKAKDDLWLIAVTFAAGGSAGVAGGANVIVFSGVTRAMLGAIAGKTITAGRDLSVTADGDERFVNAAATATVGGSAGVSAVAVVTYFKMQTAADVAANSALSAERNIRIAANSNEFVTSDAIGAAVGGSAGVGGTLDLIINKVTTTATVRSGAGVTAKTGDIDVAAKDDYRLLAIVGTIAASGSAGVGVSALVSVSFNTVSAVLGEKVKAAAGKNVNVKADAQRDADAYVMTAAGGGAAGIAASITAIVMGGKLNKDASNEIYAEGGVNPGRQVDGAFASANGAAAAYKPDDDLDAMLKADESDKGMAGHTKGFGDYGQTKEGDSGVYYDGVDEDGNAVRYTVYQDGSAKRYYKLNDKFYTKEENGEMKPAAVSASSLTALEGKTASSAGMTEAKYDETASSLGYGKTSAAGLVDGVSAAIFAGAEVNAGQDINVLASDTLSANMIAGSLGVGGAAGVGAGISFGLLSSKVSATVAGGAKLSADGNVSVRAVSGGAEGSSSNDALGDDAKEINELADKKTSGSAKDSSIRLIGVVAAGGGAAGVGVSAGVLVVNGLAQAVVSGDVLRANAVNVAAEMHFKQVLTTVVSLAAGGTAGVGVSAGATYFEGKVVSAIADGAKIGTKGNPVGSVNVTSGGDTTAIAAAAGVAGGTVGVAVNAALVINKLDIDTYIGQGVTLWSKDNVSVRSDFETTSQAFLVAAAAGGVAVGVSVVVNVSDADSRTYIGATPNIASGEQAEAGSAGSENGSINAQHVTVEGKLRADVDMAALGLAAGGVAVNGLVALGINRAANIAAINRMNIAASGRLNVAGSLAGSTKVYATSVVGGAVAVGATVALAYHKSLNGAWIDVTGAQVQAASLAVSAGTEQNTYRSTAQTLVVTGAAGGVAAALNFGVAVNASENSARITGESGGLKVGSGVNLYAFGNTEAYSVVANAGVGEITANVSVAAATLKSVQKALIDANAKIEIGGSLDVGSWQNVEKDDTNGYAPREIGVSVDREGIPSLKFGTMAEAYIFSASAGMLSLSANTATAIANATGIAGVNAANLTVAGAMSVRSYGDSRAVAKVDNFSADYNSVGLMAGYAYASGDFEATVSTDGAIAVRGGKLTIETRYIANAAAKMTPALAGVSASFTDIGVNISFAQAATIARAGISGKGAVTANSIGVYAQGKATATAEVGTPALKASVLTVALSTSAATLSANQQAYITGAQVNAGSVSVRSDLNEGGEFTSGKKGANAYVGATGGGTDVSVSLAGVGVNAAVATANMNNRATVEGAKIGGAGLYGELTVLARGTAFATADVKKPDASLSLASIAVNVLTAVVKGSFAATVDGGEMIWKA